MLTGVAEWESASIRARDEQREWLESLRGWGERPPVPLVAPSSSIGIWGTSVECAAKKVL